MLVQKLRLQRGWSQEQLAELSGLSVRTIQRMERGLPASNETLKSLASVFEIEFSTLQATQERSMTTYSASNSTSTSPPLNSSNPIINQSDNNQASAFPAQSVNADEEAAFRYVRKIRGFYGHLAKYVFVISALAVFNLIKSPSHIWVIWPALGWGLGILFHGMRVFGTMPFMNADWEKRQVEKYLGRKL